MLVIGCSEMVEWINPADRNKHGLLCHVPGTSRSLLTQITETCYFVREEE